MTLSSIGWMQQVDAANVFFAEEICPLHALLHRVSV
jgi:hypothetical protein